MKNETNQQQEQPRTEMGEMVLEGVTPPKTVEEYKQIMCGIVNLHRALEEIKKNLITTDIETLNGEGLEAALGGAAGILARQIECLLAIKEHKNRVADSLGNAPLADNPLTEIMFLTGIIENLKDTVAFLNKVCDNLSSLSDVSECFPGDFFDFESLQKTQESMGAFGTVFVAQYGEQFRRKMN